MRLLLRPGRRYEEAVKRFSPYDRLLEVQLESRTAAAQLIPCRAADRRPKRAFVFVNNRFEGNALGTIAAILEQSSDLSEPRRSVAVVQAWMLTPWVIVAGNLQILKLPARTDVTSSWNRPDKRSGRPVFNPFF